MIPDRRVLTCRRCGIEFEPKHARYLFVVWGERGASQYTSRGNLLFGRSRKDRSVVLCGPCGDQWLDRQERFELGEGLDTFERSILDRGVVRD